MGATTSIEWAANIDGTPGATWNPVRAQYIVEGEFERIGTHCVHASEGCRNCYAEKLNLRKLPGAGTGLPYTKQAESLVKIFLDERMLTAPLRRRKPTTYFLSSMTDVFADFVSDDMLAKLFAVMALSPQHTFIVLTKRAQRMRAFMDLMDDAKGVGRVALFARMMGEIEAIDGVKRGGVPFVPHPLPNVCMGVSIEDQSTANERLPHLLATTARWRAISAEPLLAHVDVTSIRRTRADGFMRPLDGQFNTVDWVICGGESGPGARPMHPDWARSLRDQCAAANVPFFFKQWGEYSIISDRDREDPDWRRCSDLTHTNPRGRWLNLAGGHGFHGERVVYADKVGKGAAGRLLDGVEHNARPDFAAGRERAA